MILCRICAARLETAERPCPSCGAAAALTHPELASLSLAHLDCDAFYASIEKRDQPALAAQPVIVGGGKRGVVSTACYIARAFGVRSAMPMFKALKLCPHAVVVKPRMRVYVEEGMAIRAMMAALTPLVQPLSIDEAFMDLAGLEALTGRTPAENLLMLQKRVEAERGLSVSIGLSFNKFLAKMASDLDKPRGFTAIGRGEALDFLTPLPVSALPGIGPAGAAALERRGLKSIGDVRKAGPERLRGFFGEGGERLYALSIAHDTRKVDPQGERKSISAETTFFDDIRSLAALEDELWPLCEKIAARARAAGLAGRTLTLKLRDARFRSHTRRRQWQEPTLLASRIFEAARLLLAADVDGETSFRLIGVSLSDLADAANADKGDLWDERTPRRAKAEEAVALARKRFGGNAVKTGRTLRIEKE